MCVQWNEPVTVPLIVAEELEHELFEDEEADENAALMHKVKGHHATPIARQMSAMSSHSNDVIDGKAETDEVSQIRSLKFRFFLSLSPFLLPSISLPLSSSLFYHSLSLFVDHVPFKTYFFSPQEEAEADIPLAPLSKIMKMNSPEWLYITVGSICSVIVGAIQPAFAFLMAEFLKVWHCLHQLQAKQWLIKVSTEEILVLILGTGNIRMNCLHKFDESVVCIER